VTYDVATSLAGQRAVKALARDEPSILLPAHDPEAPARLAAGLCVPAARPPAVAG
jgi:N-acyl homoserine lactone hydrolase